MNWLSLVGSALGGLGSIFGGLFGKKGQDDANATNLQIARETNEANRANQEYQNEWNLNMWNKQNEYNTPAAQRQRLEDAGLNPIFYGLDGTGNAGALTSAPFTAVNGAPMSNSGEFLGQGISNAALQSAQIANIQANTEKVKAETNGQTLDNMIKNATAGDVIQDAHFRMQCSEANVDYIRNNSEKVKAEIVNINNETDLIQQKIDSIAQSMTYEKLRYELDKEVKEAEIRIKESELDLREKEYQLSCIVAANNFTIGMYNAKTNRMNAENNRELFLFNKWVQEIKLPYEVDYLDSQILVNYTGATLHEEQAATERARGVNEASKNLYGELPVLAGVMRYLDSFVHLRIFNESTDSEMEHKRDYERANSKNDWYRSVRNPEGAYEYPRKPFSDN